MTQRTKTDWQQEFFDWSCNVGHVRLVVSGQYNELNVTIEDDGHEVAAGFGETLELAMLDAFANMHTRAIK